MTVVAQIEELVAAAPDPPAAERLAPHRDRLAAAAARAVELVDGHDADHVLPLRLPKGRVVDLLVCERLAVARHRAPDDDPAGAADVSPAMLRGLALDRFVQHELHGGPVADPAADLLAMLDAEGEVELREQVAAVADALRLGPLAAAARDWAGVDLSLIHI